jgi:hypothetical protein
MVVRQLHQIQLPNQLLRPKTAQQWRLRFVTVKLPAHFYQHEFLENSDKSSALRQAVPLAKGKAKETLSDSETSLAAQRERAKARIAAHKVKKQEQPK